MRPSTPSVIYEQQRLRTIRRKIVNLVRLGIDLYALLFGSIYTGLAMSAADVSPAKTFIAVMSLAVLCLGLGFLLGKGMKE